MGRQEGEVGMRVEVVRDEAGVRKAMSSLEQMGVIGVDLETTGLDPLTDRVLLLTMGNWKRQFVFDVRTAPVGLLAPLMESPAHLKALHNAKFDYKFLRKQFGIFLSRVADTMLTEQTLEAGRQTRGFGLDDLVLKYFDTNLSKELQTSFKDFSGEFSQEQIEYAARDVEWTCRLLEAQCVRLRLDQLAETADLESMCALAFGDIELNGIKLLATKWLSLSDAATKKAEAIKQELDDLFEGDTAADELFATKKTINYLSDRQVKEALKRLGISVEDTSKITLNTIRHPAAKKLIEYREQIKIVSTYGEAFLGHQHPYDGRIHCHFNQLGTETGRASCSQPNLQNIPADSEFRECFVPELGNQYVVADYSGCELRILAELSQDPHFVEAFNRGEDLHSFAAQLIFNQPVSKTENKELRDTAKTIGFGLVYGMGPQGLARRLAISQTEAKALMDKYFSAFPGVLSYLNQSGRDARTRGFSKTIGGRRRYYESSGNTSEEIASIERMGKNHAIQGTNADMTKQSLIRIRERYLGDPRILIVNTVHDEIVVEAPEDLAEEVAVAVQEEMKRSGETYLKTVPTEVEIHVASCWKK